MKKHLTIKILAFAFSVLIIAGCNQSNKKTDTQETADTTAKIETTVADAPAVTDTTNMTVTEPTKELPKVLVYNFHITNRCASCIAIEEATTKTLKTYFAAELKQGRVKQYILNVDDKANDKIAEKYQAFGSGIYVTRVLKGKETTADLTGDGFKFARNKEERFIEILKNKISEYLK